MGYHTIGRLAMGRIALGFSSGFDVKVGNDDPGPQRMSACSPVEGIDMAWGILTVALAGVRPIGASFGTPLVRWEAGSVEMLCLSLEGCSLRVPACPGVRVQMPDMFEDAFQKES